MEIPVTIISGYLGAGKTTLINHLLATLRGVRLAVLVNDFGALNIDSSLIESRDGDTISLSNGCVCCSIQDDLGAALDMLTKQCPPPDQIVMETSGVSEPGRILRYATGWPGVRLDAVITVVDAETVQRRVEDKFVGSVVRRQIAAADFVILNKTDLISDDTQDRVLSWLSSKSPGANLVSAIEGRVDTALILGASCRSPVRADEQRTSLSPTPAFASRTIGMPGPVSLQDLEECCARIPASVHRLKGFVRDADTGRLMLFQRVAHRQSITVAPASAGLAQCALVAIGTSEQDLEMSAAKIAELVKPNKHVANHVPALT